MILNKIHNFFNSPLGMTLLTGVTFLIAFVVSHYEGVLGYKNLLIGGGFTLLLITITMIIFANFSRLTIKEEYEENNKILKGFIEAQGLGDLISEKELARVESEADNIWVFTLDLSHDIAVETTNKQENEIFIAVKENLAKGKKYTYFLPDEPSKYGAINEFKKHHTYKDGQVKFCMIPIKEYHIVSEIVIYDKKLAIQWFPSKNMNYYIKIDKLHMMNILGSGELLLTKYLKDLA